MRIMMIMIMMVSIKMNQPLWNTAVYWFTVLYAFITLCIKVCMTTSGNSHYTILQAARFYSVGPTYKSSDTRKEKKNPDVLGADGMKNPLFCNHAFNIYHIIRLHTMHSSLKWLLSHWRNSGHPSVFSTIWQGSLVISQRSLPGSSMVTVVPLLLGLHLGI